ncbi:MAG: MMPL family transporter, partial [Actinobacteria bacterium]|nr:MMPL family transporter [Actinomycetota bacterium]
MKSIAEFAIRRRWFVIAGWIVLIVAAQGIAGALGGAAYKDTFSLPHTETASVAKLLKDAGLDSQNGVAGTVVLKNKNNQAFADEPSQVQSALAKQCTTNNHVALIASPWQSIDCSKPNEATAGNAKLLNSTRGSNTALVTITWQSDHFDPTLFKNVYNSLKTLNSDTLEVEFTGNAFAGIGQSSGSGASVFIGFLA